MSTDSPAKTVAIVKNSVSSEPPNVVAAKPTSDLSKLSQQKIVIENKIDLPIKQPIFWETYPFLSPLFAVLISAWIAHTLTKQRDRDKQIQELIKTIEDQVSIASEAASHVWEERRGPKRLAAIAKTIGRVQLIAGLVRRLKVESRRNSIRVGPIWLPWPKARFIDLGKEMVTFRRQITGDPFNDNSRNADKSQLERVEQTMYDFVASMHKKWADWAFGPIESGDHNP